MRRLARSALAGLAIAILGIHLAAVRGPVAGATTRPRTHAVEQATRAVEEFWATTFAQISTKRFTPLRGGLVAQHASGPDVRCGATTITAKAIADNALYCPSSDTIVWDADRLGPHLVREFGPLAVAVVVAHEYGHAIQERTASPRARVTTELQADCYAGAFAGAVMAGQVPSIRAARDDFSRPLLALLRLGDTPGTRPDTKTAHGNGFDRVSSFLVGTSGAPSCAQYANAPPALTAQSFADQGDRARRGNLALSDEVTKASADLNDHYRVIAGALGATWTEPAALRYVDGAATCPGMSAPETSAATWCGTEVIVSTRATARLNDIGDLAVGAELARAWAIRAERVLPQSLAADDPTTECLTGVWLGSLHPRAPQRPTRRFELSPGDLDEVARAELVDPIRAHPIDRIAATLRGFTDGLPACVRTTLPEDS